MLPPSAEETFNLQLQVTTNYLLKRFETIGSETFVQTYTTGTLQQLADPKERLQSCFYIKLRQNYQVRESIFRRVPLLF